LYLRGFRFQQAGEKCMMDLGTDGSIILKWISGTLGLGSVDWIHLAQGIDRRRIVVITVISLLDVYEVRIC
jgi:hypothetical protein